MYVHCIATRLCRIIAAGEMMKECALPRRVDIPRWPRGPNLSDHQPVSIDLQCLKRKRPVSCSKSPKRRRTGGASS